jgi:small-conductance mechanosensitive channel
VGDFLSFRLFRVSGTDVTVSSLAIAVGILVLTWIASRVAKKVVAERLLGRTHLAVGARYAVGRFLGYLIWLVGGMLALNAIGVNATSLAAFSAALGVGIGFGLQDVVKNFIAGIIVLLERPIQVGDRIEIDKQAGDVVEIRTRSTVIRTNDDVYLIVPNAKFITDTVVNWSFRSGRIRFRAPIGVASDSNPREVEEALLAAAAKTKGILAEPAPSVYFKGFGDFTLEFELLAWTAQMLHRKPAFISDMNFAIWEELSGRGIRVPNPQRDIHIRSADGIAGIAGLSEAIEDATQRKEGRHAESR